VPRLPLNNASEDFQRRILDNLVTAVILLDRDLALRYLNPAAEETFGVSGRQAFGQSLDRLLVNTSELETIAGRVLQSGSAYAGRDLELYPREMPGDCLVMDCSVSCLDPELDGGSLLLELQDTTRLRRISREAELMIQHGVSRKIIRQLAHEIKNPLGGIRGAAQLLQRQLLASSLQEYTSVIVHEVDRLANLIDRMLGPTRPLELQSSNVHELLARVQHLLRAEAAGDIRFRQDYDPSLPPMNLDRDLMIQVFLNLGRNAIQSMEHAGELMLRTRALSNYTLGNRLYKLVASIEFHDSGPGVNPSVADTLFYPLVTGRKDGSGLGLPIAQELVNRHEGLIEFTSRPGHTVFQVLLPLSAPSESSDEH